MAAITPEAATVTGWVDAVRGLYTGQVALTETVLANAVHDRDRPRFRTAIYFFADNIANGDTWTSNIPGIKAVFTCEDDPDAAQHLDATLTNAAKGVITFDVVGAGNVAKCWVLLFIDSDNPNDGFPGR